ncbi:MAG: ATP-binding protein [Clostridiales bacterium]|jgi:anti-sigma regulatory factor (Ser/Thr protein kinase)|nr:ATP-binding protein [Clostridiales bacterium]
MILDALISNLPDVLAFVDESLEKRDCPMRVQMQIDIAVEEIFVNIASYAYTPEIGKAEILIQEDHDPEGITITFIDTGIPYDPLAKPDPDVTLSANQRQIGGLGIYMVKKSMTDMTYRYEENRNILTIRKEFA